MKKGVNKVRKILKGPSRNTKSRTISSGVNPDGAFVGVDFSALKSETTFPHYGISDGKMMPTGEPLVLAYKLKLDKCPPLNLVVVGSSFMECRFEQFLNKLLVWLSFGPLKFPIFQGQPVQEGPQEGWHRNLQGEKSVPKLVVYQSWPHSDPGWKMFPIKILCAHEIP